MNNETIILDFLEASNKNVVDVFDGITGKSLQSKATLGSILSEFESVKDWLKSFKDNGVETLQIFKLTKQGSSYSRITPVIIADFKEPKQPMMPKQQTSFSNDFGMNGGAFGMNGAQIIAAVSKEMDYNRLETAFEREKNKSQQLEQLLNDTKTALAKAELGLATAQRENDLNIKEVQNSQKGVLDSAIAEKLVDNLPALIAAFKASMPSTAVGLGQPANDAGLSSAKAQFINAIKSPDVTDDILVKLYVAIDGMIKDQNFKAAFVDMLRNFNLIPA